MSEEKIKAKKKVLIKEIGGIWKVEFRIEEGEVFTPRDYNIVRKTLQVQYRHYRMECRRQTLMNKNREKRELDTNE